MIVGEERDQRQDADDLQLHFAGAMRHVLGQSVQAQVKDADHKDHQQDEDDHHVEENVGLTRRGDERRQMGNRSRMQGIFHLCAPPSYKVAEAAGCGKNA